MPPRMSRHWMVPSFPHKGKQDKEVCLRYILNLPNIDFIKTKGEATVQMYPSII